MQYWDILIFNWEVHFFSTTFCVRSDYNRLTWMIILVVWWGPMEIFVLNLSLFQEGYSSKFIFTAYWDYSSTCQKYISTSK